MISLRHFGSNDVSVLQKKRYPDMTCHEIAEMIREWNSCEYDGRYFEMFAVISDGRTVGSISVFENSRSAAEIGPDIFPDERRKGFAYEAMLQRGHVPEKVRARLMAAATAIPEERRKRNYEYTFSRAV